LVDPSSRLYRRNAKRQPGPRWRLLLPAVAFVPPTCSPSLPEQAPGGFVDSPLLSMSLNHNQFARWMKSIIRFALVAADRRCRGARDSGRSPGAPTPTTSAPTRPNSSTIGDHGAASTTSTTPPWNTSTGSNHRRILEPIGDIPPARREDNHYRQNSPANTAGLTRTSLR